MSSRALRKLQREREEKSRLEKLQEDASDDEVEQHSPVQARKANAFSFLNAAEDDEEPSDPKVEEKEAGSSVTPRPAESDSSNPPTKKPKKKRKKKATQPKPPPHEQKQPEHEDDSKLDEIDAALRSLRIDDGNAAQNRQPAGPDEAMKAFFDLLAVDSKHLNPLNEMKKLFGNTVLANEGSDAAAGRRRGRGPQALDLSAALTARYNPYSRGQGLSGLVTRRNIFIPGKEEWPKATSGGLGMEMVERAWDFTTEFRFMHSKIYEESQKEFNYCVETLDPQAMITLLQLRPYHISTLVQVSEIAKHQGDHAVAADLMERALFTFGRSVHSSFGAALAEGKARLDYRRFENREFWLAGWRYITSLGQRGTWRTAFEWAKLLLSLDPEGDPLCMHLIIDQLAIRGGEFDSLIKLASTGSLDWGQKSPNVQISLALAYYKLKHPEEAREQLSRAVTDFPWVFERLFKAINIDHVPKSIWGRKARTIHEELMGEAYAVRAKDMWNIPEALSLLIEVAETTERSEPPPPDNDTTITLNEARHFILADTPALIAFLPRAFTHERISATDPLPPDDDYVDEPEGAAPANAAEEEGRATDPLATQPVAEQSNEAEESRPGLQSWITGMFSRFDIRGMLPTFGQRALVEADPEPQLESDPESDSEPESPVASDYPRDQVFRDLIAQTDPATRAEVEALDDDRLELVLHPFRHGMPRTLHEHDRRRLTRHRLDSRRPWLFTRGAQSPGRTYLPARYLWPAGSCCSARRSRRPR